MIIQRPDVASGVRFPAILRLFPLRWQRFALVSKFIPTRNGGINSGSVLFVCGRLTPE